ncbi:hypothetical protein EJB05_50804, partial [Eragrostis curvula]
MPPWYSASSEQPDKSEEVAPLYAFEWLPVLARWRASRCLRSRQSTLSVPTSSINPAYVPRQEVPLRLILRRTTAAVQLSPT